MSDSIDRESKSSPKPTYQELEQELGILKHKYLEYVGKEIVANMPKKQKFSTYVYHPTEDATFCYSSTFPVALNNDWMPALLSGYCPLIPKGTGVCVVTDAVGKTMYFRFRNMVEKQNFTNLQVSKCANKLALKILETYEKKEFKQSTSSVLMEINEDAFPSLWAQVLTHRIVLDAIEEITHDLKSIVFALIKPSTELMILEIRYQRQPLQCLREKYIVVS